MAAATVKFEFQFEFKFDQIVLLVNFKLFVGGKSFQFIANNIWHLDKVQ